MEYRGVNHRHSSVTFRHGNCRAETGFKTIKRLITNNTGPNGDLDTDAFQRAILQYKDTPDRATKLSPAMSVFGRPIIYFSPVMPDQYHPHSTWRETIQAHDEALRNRHLRATERWAEHTSWLPPLIVGDTFRIHNQPSPHPNKSNKTDKVIEVRKATATASESMARIVSPYKIENCSGDINPYS